MESTPEQRMAETVGPVSMDNLAPGDRIRNQVGAELLVLGLHGVGRIGSPIGRIYEVRRDDRFMPLFFEMLATPDGLEQAGYEVIERQGGG